MESRKVPSVLVLVVGRESSLSSVADAAVAGAKRVRFTEVTARAADADVFRYRRLESDADLASFDGLVVVSPDESMTPVALPTAVQRLADTTSATNTVIALVGGGPKTASQLLALGGITLSARGASLEEMAGAAGERVARVAGWVRHALGHEAEHQHGHDHPHHHRHDQEHGHRHEHGAPAHHDDGHGH